MTAEAFQLVTAGSQFEVVEGPDGVQAAARIIEAEESASGRALALFPCVGVRIQLLMHGEQPADRLGLDVNDTPQHPHVQTLTVTMPSGIMDLTVARSMVCKPVDAHVAVGCIRATVSIITDGRSVTGHSVQVDLSDGPLVMVYVDKDDRFRAHAAPDRDRIAVWVPRGTFG